MFCPSCRSEYRSGFTRCADCEVDLVDDLNATTAEPAPAPAPAPAPHPPGEPMLEYCGFFAIDEARQARDQLWLQGIRSEILIREAPDSDRNLPPREEFWLRVGRSQLQRAATILGYDEEEEAAETESFGTETIACPACGKPVASDESFCASCGARFESRR